MMRPLPMASIQARRASFDLRTWGTFTRASEATYMIAAPTTGATPFLLTAYNNARRIEDRGDGNGAMLLLEGTGKNWFADSESFASWTAAAATITNNAGLAPDGSSTADRLQTAIGGTGANSSFAGVTPSIDWIGTTFRRSPSGTTSSQEAIGATGGWASGNNSLGTTYERAICSALPSNASTEVGMWVADGRHLTAFGGIGAGARDELTWGRQLEQMSFATSYIRSEAAPFGTTRSPDILTGATSTVPVSVLNGVFAFDVAPVFSSTGGIRHAADQCLFSFAEDDSERVFFVVSGGAIYIRVTSGGVTKVTSSALTFSAQQKLSVTLDGAAGSITVAGATTGNGTVTGTAWTRTTGATTYVGSRQGGTQPAYVRLSVPAYTADDELLVFLMLGQSNMQGLHAGHPQSIPGKILGAIQGTFRRGKKVDYAVGGTTLAIDWNKTGGAQYAGMLAAWDAALAANPTLSTYTPVIVWGQGESDASSAPNSAAYGANLAAFFTNLETDRPFFAGCKIIIHALWPENGIDGTPGWPNNATIRAAQAAYAAANPSRVALIETSDLTTYDTVHFVEASTDVIAARDAAAVRTRFA